MAISSSINGFSNINPYASADFLSAAQLSSLLNPLSRLEGPSAPAPAPAASRPDSVSISSHHKHSHHQVHGRSHVS